MSRTLHVFVRSPNPNPYLNSIVHCVQRKDVSRVVFASIKKSSEGVLEIAQLASNVQLLLEKLSEGVYTYWEFQTREQKAVDLSAYYDADELKRLCIFYKSCLDILGSDFSNNVSLISYSQLRDYVSLIRRTEDAIFDITATTNDLVSDVVAISITEGISALYSFASLNQPRAGAEGWRSLIHHLESEQSGSKPAYQYINLLDTPIYREAIFRIYGPTGKSDNKNNKKVKISEDAVKGQLQLLAAHRETLNIYLQQQARTGSAFSQPSTTNGITEAQRAIQRIKSTLRGWEIEVTDLPDDEM